MGRCYETGCCGTVESYVGKEAPKDNWLDRAVNVPKVSSLTLEQWIGEFNRLKKLNEEMLSGKVPKS